MRARRTNRCGLTGHTKRTFDGMHLIILRPFSVARLLVVAFSFTVPFIAGRVMLGTCTSLASCVALLVSLGS
jgi:hypothetical protein